MRHGGKRTQKARMWSLIRTWNKARELKKELQEEGYPLSEVPASIRHYLESVDEMPEPRNKEFNRKRVDLLKRGI